MVLRSLLEKLELSADEYKMSDDQLARLATPLKVLKILWKFQKSKKQILTSIFSQTIKSQQLPCPNLCPFSRVTALQVIKV